VVIERREGEIFGGKSGERVERLSR